MNRFEKRDNSSKVVLIVVLSVVGVGLLVVLACGGLTFLFVHKAGQALGPAFQAAADLQEADTVVQVFLNELAVGQVEEAYKGTTAGFRGKQTFVQFKAFVERNPLLTKFTDAQQAPVNNPPGAVRMTIRYTLSGNGILSLTFQLVKEGEQWRIDGLTSP